MHQNEETIAFLRAEWDRSRQTIESLQGQVREQAQTLQHLAAALKEKTRLAEGLADRLEAIASRAEWRLMGVLRRCRRRLAPPGSRREQWARTGIHLLRRARAGKLKALPRRLWSWGRTRAARLRAHLFSQRGPAPASVIARAHASPGTVIFLPSIGWHVHLFQRPHHLAREFARQGWLAIFDCSNAADPVTGFQEIEPNLFLYRGPEAVLHQLPNPVLWTFPYNYDRTDAYPETRTVYDWIDDLAVFTHDRALLERNHRRALREATVVASVAQRLHEQVRAVRADALYLPNAVDVPHFADDARAIPDDPKLTRLRREGKPVAGYYGALAAWFDYDLLDAVAGLRPDWNFVLIGPMYDDSLRGHPILQRANVCWIGPRDYATLPGYLRLFDVALIPFLLNDITLATSPLKLFEYFAGGKPVITTAMPECLAFPEVHIVRNAGELARSLDLAREQGKDESFRQRLRALAQANSWTERVRLTLRHLQRRTEEDRAESGEDTDPRVRSIAARFRQLRTRRNQHFFAALARYFAELCDHPCLPMHLEYALTSNERGRCVVDVLRRRIDLKGKRVLDVGCAYGGFLAAFAEQGATVAGLDVNPELLDLARENLQASGWSATLLHRDITREGAVAELLGGFDVVTCNNVIEHVLDPAAAIHHIAAVLDEGGTAYFEVLNGRCPQFVRQDGHYQLFGITLLERTEAAAYHAAHAPAGAYDVGHYLELGAYRELFAEAGLELQVLEETYAHVDLAQVLADVEKLRAGAAAGLATVPEPLRELVEQRLAQYLDELDRAPRKTAAEKQAFKVRYGASFWRVLGRKTASVPLKGSTAKTQTLSGAGEQTPPGDFYSRLTLLPCLDAGQQKAILNHRPLAAKLSRPDVICFSIIDWSFRYQRPQQLMAQFAAQGHRVFYINLTEFLPADASPRFQLRPIQPNIYDVSLAVKRRPKVYHEVLAGADLEALLASLDDLRRSQGLNEVVSYVMIASWGAAALRARQRWNWRVLYDCMDDWEHFSGIGQPLIAMEDQLVQQCDLLVVTAQRLYDKWRRYNRPTVLARNAVDYPFYVQRCHPNHVLPDASHPIVGYYGAIADWFDLELLEHVAGRRPQYTFVLLGGVFDVDVSRLQALPNVRLLGQQPYETMPQYLFHFDACLIPFKINPVTAATDPVKLYEYLSAGKPVVSVALPEVEQYRDYLYIAGDADDFIAKLDAALSENDPELAARRRALAQQHTWEARWRQIDRALTDSCPRASIIVVTYNNLALTRLCLESILRNTEHLNYELIVVDNHSTDGTPAYLRYLAGQHANLTIILNADNHGFARANNQGLAQATGEHLVLLNNDTIVPRGWLSRLLHHLHDPEVGLVGPVTNAVGNEARIEVSYRTWAEMEAWAQKHTADHDGQSADIHMLAMYCVAFRRETYRRVGPLDEQFGIGMFEDDDYSIRVKRAGLRVICALDVFVHHFGQAAFSQLIKTGQYDALFEANRQRYEAKWEVTWVAHRHAPLKPCRLDATRIAA